MATTTNATIITVPTRFNRVLRKSDPVATFAQADGCTIHCEPGDEKLAVAHARAKAAAFGLTPYTPKGQSDPAQPKTLGPSRRVPGFVCLALNFARPDHAQTDSIARDAQ